MRVCWRPSSSFVAQPDFAERVDTALVVVAEVVGDQLEVGAVHVAPPDGAGPGSRCCSTSTCGPLPSERLQPVHALNRPTVKYSLPSGPDVDARGPRGRGRSRGKPESSFFGGPVGVPIAVEVPRRRGCRETGKRNLARASLAVGNGCDADADRGNEVRGLVRRPAPCPALPTPLVVFEDDNAIATLPQDRPARMALRRLVHRLTRDPKPGRGDRRRWLVGFDDHRLGGKTARLEGPRRPSST